MTTQSIGDNDCHDNDNGDNIQEDIDHHNDTVDD